MGLILVNIFKSDLLNPVKPFEIEIKIKKWLQYAGDLEGGCKNRIKEKTQRNDNTKYTFCKRSPGGE